MGFCRSMAFLCVMALWYGSCCADDDLQKFSALLSQADVLSKSFQGEFVFHSGEDRDNHPLDFGLDGLDFKTKGRIWVESGNAVVEFLGSSDMTAVGKGSQFNDIVEVLAVSDGTYFDFISTGSPQAPYANLRIHNADTSDALRTRLNDEPLGFLNAIPVLGGFPIESLLVDPNGIVRVDAANGYYSVHADYRDVTNPSTINFELTVTGRAVKCTSKITAGAPTISLTTELLVEADLNESSIVPRRVAKRLSGPGYGVARREVMQFTPRELGTLKFPITSEFFRKYERDYPVLRGNAEESKEFVRAVPEQFMTPLQDRLNPNSKVPAAGNATRWTIAVAGNLFAALALLVWWYLARKGRKDA